MNANHMPDFIRQTATIVFDGSPIPRAWTRFGCALSRAANAHAAAFSWSVICDRLARMELALPAYNATVTEVRHIHDELLVLRIEPDFGRLEFMAGQYTTLGLGSWEPHVACDEPTDLTPELIRRAYSISHSPLDEREQLVRPGEREELEFYIALVRKSPKGRPLLTPRLFCLEPGKRVFVGPHVHGAYTLAHLPRNCDCLFAATGTGEAPHNAMIAELLASNHPGRIASLVCVRHRRDLAYAAAHRKLAERYSNYRYIPLTTRESENIDPARPGYLGKRYVQDVLRSAEAQRILGFALVPERAHVFLCGNPEMIGLGDRHDRATSSGAIHILESLGFHIDSAAHPGNIHFERYY